MDGDEVAPQPETEPYEPGCPWPVKIIDEARQAVLDYLGEGSHANLAQANAPPGQPYYLSFMEGLARSHSDPDVSLFESLSKGVRTGCLTERPIPTSGTWLPPESAEKQAKKGALKKARTGTIQMSSLDTMVGSEKFLICEGNWKTVESNTDIAEPLVQAEVKDGYAKEWPGTIEDAREAFPLGVAQGRLKLALAQGRKPRLCLDSTRCLY